jgi:hypothetical protein
MIWLRLTVNGLDERNPAFNRSHSSSTIPLSRTSVSGLH